MTKQIKKKNNSFKILILTLIVFIQIHVVFFEYKQNIKNNDSVF